MAGKIEKNAKNMEEIEGHLANSRSFVLNGGAGSGKTYSMMRVLDMIYATANSPRVACITYTKRAVAVIRSRSKYGNLWVSTIHEFLWDCIKTYQANLRTCLVALIQEGATDESSACGISYKGEIKIESGYFLDKKIEYQDYRKIENGIISHDEVLKLANRLFRDYPLIRSIFKDRYTHLLIDEYQDASPVVIELFLEHLQLEKAKPHVIGLFGDPMQSIYPKTIGDVEKYIKSGVLFEVKKQDNYRCSQAVIKVLNKIRSDIQQSPSKLDENGKIANKKGSATFLYSNDENIEMDAVKNHQLFKHWNFADSEYVKELYLTKRLIANKQGFSDLVDNYYDPSRLLDDSKDALATHCERLQEVIHLYQTRQYNEFIQRTHYRLKRLSCKRTLREKMDKLINASEMAIDEVINLGSDLGLVPVSDKLQLFKTERREDYDKIKSLKYSNVINWYNFSQDYSLYSTQHGVKGEEYQNVLAVLDNGKWNLYNFQYYFQNTPGKESVIERTLKIFYVCCSRAEDNLVVFMRKPDAGTIKRVKEIFGEMAVVEMT